MKGGLQHAMYNRHIGYIAFAVQIKLVIFHHRLGIPACYFPIRTD